MPAMNYMEDPKLPLFSLGTNPSNLYVVPTIDGITPNIPDLIGLLLGGGGVTIFAVREAYKYTKTGVTAQAVQCPAAVGEMSPQCKAVPPKNDAVPSPSTIFGATSAITQMCVVHPSLEAATALMNAATAPTGFWFLDIGDGQYVTIEVGIDP